MELDSHLSYLRERWEAGCHNIAQLYRELFARGYTHSYWSVYEQLVRFPLNACRERLRNNGTIGRRHAMRERRNVGPNHMSVIEMAAQLYGTLIEKW